MLRDAEGNRRTQNSGAFSLGEIVLTLSVVSFSLVAILGLLPVALSASKEAMDETHAGLIVQDAVNRVRAEIRFASYFTHPTASGSRASGPFAPLPAPPWEMNATGAQMLKWYYDEQGCHLPQATAGPGLHQDFTSAHYLAIVTFEADWAASSREDIDAQFLRPVTVVLRWPVDSKDGTPLGNNRECYTFGMRRP